MKFENNTLETSQNELICKILAYKITILIHEKYESGVMPDCYGTAPLFVDTLNS